VQSGIYGNIPRHAISGSPETPGCSRTAPDLNFCLHTEKHIAPNHTPQWTTGPFPPRKTALSGRASISILRRDLLPSLTALVLLSPWETAGPLSNLIRPLPSSRCGEQEQICSSKFLPSLATTNSTAVRTLRRGTMPAPLQIKDPILCSTWSQQAANDSIAHFGYLDRNAGTAANTMGRRILAVACPSADEWIYANFSL
jgi:hypothetical protein